MSGRILFHQSLCKLRINLNCKAAGLHICIIKIIKETLLWNRSKKLPVGKLINRIPPELTAFIQNGCTFPVEHLADILPQHPKLTQHIFRVAVRLTKIIILNSLSAHILTKRYFTLHQRIHFNSKNLGQFRQHRNIRTAFAAFPFRNRLVAHITFFGQLFLSKPFSCAQVVN